LIGGADHEIGAESAREPAFDLSPYLAIVSPVMRCGKSTLLRWLLQVVRRPLRTMNISSASLFRTIEDHRPTLLVDEVDRYLNDRSSEVIGMLNAGHERCLAG